MRAPVGRECRKEGTTDALPDNLGERGDLKPFPLVDVSGPPYERGFQHGRACGDLIRRYATVLAQGRGQQAGQPDAKPALTEEELGRRALLFLPRMQEFAPDQVEEIRGIAAGAELPFEIALLANVRGEVFGVDRPQPGCTAVALGRGATADGSVLIGQNQDQGPAMQELVVILRVVPERGPRMLMATFGGLIGYGGISSAGIGYMMNALNNSVWRMGLPHYPVKRALLEQDDLAGCLGVFDRAWVGSSANNLLVDRNNLADVELTPHGYEVLEPDPRRGDFLVHTNHFRSACLAADERMLPRLPDSAPRCERMETLVRERHGSLTLADLKTFLSDHDGRPTSICRHAETSTGNPMQSIYSVIGEPDRGLLHVSVGNPCESPYFTYQV
jgi:isopenicillin-N N-acyltransferase like protein